MEKKNSSKTFLILYSLLIILIYTSFVYAENNSSCTTGLCGTLKNEEIARRQAMLNEELKRYAKKKQNQTTNISKSEQTTTPVQKISSKDNCTCVTKEVCTCKNDKNKTTKRKPKYSKKSVIKATTVIAQPVEIFPEKTVWVRLSNRDVNRIVCVKGEITYLMTSQEKGVITTIKNDEAYIKFKALLNNGKVTYATKPTEFFVRCAGETYSFIGTPEEIVARTIYLNSLSNDIVPDENLLQKNRVDEAITDIVRTVFTDRIPTYWQRPDKKIQFSFKKNMGDYKIKIEEKNRYRIPGIPILVRVFEIETNKKVQITEKILIDPNITINPVAISLLDHIIIPKVPTRAVILERLFN